MRPVIALDPSLGLRRTRGDDLNPQRRAHAAKLRPGDGPGHLLRRIRHPHIHVFPIRIERQRHAVRLNPPTQHIGRRPDRFLATEPRERPARGIVDQVHQAAARRARLVPQVKAPIELHQFAEMRLALPPLPVGRPFPRPDSTGLRRASSASGCRNER